MASTQTTKKLSANLKVQSLDFDPDGTGATDVAWRDMQDYGSFMAIFTRKIGTGNVSSFKILANDKADGSGTDVEIKAHAIGSQPDALNDSLVLECSAEEIGALGDANGVDLRYVSASIAFATGTDEGQVTYVFGDPRHARAGLTADAVA